MSSNNTGETRNNFVWGNNEEIRLGNETRDIIERLIHPFITNFQNKEAISRNGSNFV